MTKTTVSTPLIDAYVKVFLSCSHKMSPKNKPIWWWTKGNLVSFLNFREQIDKYGHLRFYWEGNRERFVQYIKPILQNMRKTDTYIFQKMVELNTIRAIRELLTVLDVPGRWLSETRKRYKPVKIYNNSASMSEALMKYFTLSVIILNDESHM